MNGLRMDFRLGVRQVVRRPGFTAAIVLSLALGIGANSAVFSVVDATLMRPLPVPEPDRLVAIYTTRAESVVAGGFSQRDLADYREALSGEVFTELMGHGGVPFSLAGERAAELVWGEQVTAGYFTGLGVEPAAGRLFGPTDFADDPGRRLAVLAHGLWLRRFGGDPAAVGRTIQLTGHDYTVVGVAREGFSGVKFLGYAPEVWVPAAARARAHGDTGLIEDRGRRALELYG
ncbi:MAG: ABC transporter permease, partial [Gammaproteobacteria bacterium]